MLPYILLFLEIVLFVAIGYIYWQTRILAGNLPSLAPHLPDSTGQTQSQAEMMRDVATLITEWESVTSAVRADLSNEQTRVEETVAQAEVAIAKLQGLIVGADLASAHVGDPLRSPLRPVLSSSEVEASKVNPVEQQPTNHITISRLDASLSHAADTPPTTLTEAIRAFSDYLRANHYGQSTITRTAKHVQKFAAWLSGQSEIELPLRPIVLAEIELYRRRLEAQQTPLDTIEREVAALKMFANWINTLDKKISPEVSYPASISSFEPRSTELLAGASSVRSFERYQTVFTLAQQGATPATITAQTGLEREAVRLLLTIGPPSPVKN